MAVRPLAEAFTARALGIAWNNYKQSLMLPPYLGRSFFGTNKKAGLELKYILGSGKNPVSLKASNFGAQAPLREGIGFKDIQNNMPFFRESYMVTEKEEQDYMSYIDSNRPEFADQILREIMKNPLDLVRGAAVVPERMIWSLLAPEDGVPKINVMIDGASPYQIAYTDDNGAAYKATNFMEITTTVDKWTSSGSATPIQDMLEARRQHRMNRGEVLTYFIMNESTWEMMCNCDDTKKQLLGAVAYANGDVLTDADARSRLESKFGIQVLIYNQIYVDETGVNKAFIPDGMVTAIPETVTTLGTVWYGTTPEERSGSLAGGNLSITETGITLYTYTTEHPVNTHCVCSQIVLPSYEGMNSVFVMKVA